MPPTYRIAKLEKKIDELRKVHDQYKHMDEVFCTSADKGFSFYVIRDLWLAIKEAIKENDEDPV